jgi:putative phosphoribosyl transferase
MQWAFRDRREAGRMLAERVAAAVGGSDVLVLGLPKGGVAVAYEIARRLGAQLDVLVVRKLEVSDASLEAKRKKKKVAVGVIAAGGVRVLDSATMEKLHVPLGDVEEVARDEAVELARLERYYRGGRQSPRMMGREIVLVDDGLSPAPNLRAAADALAAYRPSRVVVALPAGSPDVCADVRQLVGTVICARPTDDGGPPEHLYEEESISNREVRHLLAEADAREHGHQLAG